MDNKLLCLGTSRLDSPTSYLGKVMKLSGGLLYKHAKPNQKIYIIVVHCEKQSFLLCTKNALVVTQNQMPWCVKAN